MKTYSNGLTSTEIASNIKEWIKDLRSGKFKQGRGQLCTAARGYCCLGVGVETAIRLGYDIVRRKLFFGGVDYTATDVNGNPLSNHTLMPKSVAVLFGIVGVVGVPLRGLARRLARRQNTYSAMNDLRGMSFAEIADYIEQKLLPLYESA